jgi:hypothetical protein
MGSIPNGSAPLQACARQILKLHHRAAPEGASSISRGGALVQCSGFVTCGLIGAGTPRPRPTLVGSTAVTARVHAACVRGHGLTRQCRNLNPPRLRDIGAASVLGRLGNPSSRAGATPPF